MILCIGPTPAAQRVMVFKQFHLDEVNRASNTVDGAAGKAVNVAKVLKTLGEKPLCLGFLGGDHGRCIRADLQGRQVESAFIEVHPPTRQCVTVIDQAAQTQTELVEESRPLPAAAYGQLLDAVQKYIPGARAAIMSGTLTPGAPNDFYARCTELGRRHGALTIVDAQGAALMQALRERPALAKPNRSELANTCGFNVANERALFNAIRDLHEQGAQRVIVTNGKKPAIAFDGKNYFRIEPPSIRAINPIGSGDAFTAGLAWRLLLGDELHEACRWGAACGAANALTLTPGDLDADQVSQLVKQVAVEPATPST